MSSLNGPEGAVSTSTMNNVRKLKKSRKSKPKGPSTPTRDQYEVPSTTPPPSSVKRKLGDGHDKADKKGKKKHRASNQELNTDENHENDVTASRRDKSQDVDAQLSSLTSQSQRHSSLNKPTTPAGEEDSFVKTSGVRGPRLKSDGRPLKIGFFTKEEVQKIEKFKVDFCNQHSLESHKEFDHLVQHSERTSAEPWPLDADVCSKQQFWEQIYELAPDRDRRSLYRFMRRHFQESFQKAHEWTPAQDEELIQLMREHSGKWTAVAKMLGRSDDDVTQRWKNKLQHRDKMNRGSWSEKELRDLLDGVERFFALYKKEHEDASCIDIYEMPDGHITWSHISDSMDNMRTRQQCADKWRKIRNKVLNARAAGETNAVFDVVAEAKKPPRAFVAPPNPKSDFYVDVNDDGSGYDVLKDIKQPPSSVSQRAPRLGFADFQSSLKTNGAAGTTEDLTQEPLSDPDDAENGENHDHDAEMADVTSAIEQVSTPPASVDNQAANSHKEKKKKKSKKHHEDVQEAQSIADPEPSSPAKSQEDMDKKARKAAKKAKKERKRLEREQKAREQKAEEERSAAESQHQDSLNGTLMDDAQTSTPSQSRKSTKHARSEDASADTPKKSLKKHKKQKRQAGF